MIRNMNMKKIDIKDILNSKEKEDGTYLYVSMVKDKYCMVERSEDEGLWLVSKEGIVECDEEFLEYYNKMFYNRDCGVEEKDMEWLKEWVGDDKVEVFCWW